MTVWLCLSLGVVHTPVDSTGNYCNAQSKNPSRCSVVLLRDRWLFMCACNLLVSLHLLQLVDEQHDFCTFFGPPSPEAHIHDDIAKCRDSTKSHDPAGLSDAIDSLAVRSKRVARVAETEAQATTDPSYKKPLHSAAMQLDKGNSCDRVYLSCTQHTHTHT